jgi:integrase
MSSYADFTRRILALYSPPMRRKATRDKMRLALSEFAQICPDTRSIGPEAIAAWIAAHPERSPIASFSLLRSFASACRAGKELGILRSDPFAFRPPARWWPEGSLEPPERPRHHPPGELARVLEQSATEAASGSWEALRLDTLIRLYVFTGMRRSEALGLLAADVDLEGEALEIRPNGRRQLKTRASRRRLAMPEPLARAIRRWLPRCGSDWLIPHKGLSGPWLSGRVGHKPLDQVKALGRRAGVEGLTILSIRHTYATLGEQLGFGELLLQRLLGHRSRRTQLGYRHAEDTTLRDAAERFRL